MLSYIIKRLLLIIPTLLGIILINFIIVQAAPGGPVEQVISQIKGHNIDSTSRIAGTDKGEVASHSTNIQTNQSVDTSSKGGHRVSYFQLVSDLRAFGRG